MRGCAAAGARFVAVDVLVTTPVTNWVTVTGAAMLLGGLGVPLWFRREIFGVGGRRRSRRFRPPKPVEPLELAEPLEPVESVPRRTRPSRPRTGPEYAGTHYGGRIARPGRTGPRTEPAELEFMVNECADRIDGWVRPHYRDFPEPQGAPPPGAEPYGWPIPVERPAVYADKHAAE